MTGHVIRGFGIRPADLALVGGIALPVLMDAWWSAPGTRQADALTYSLVTLSLLALLWRRPFPIQVALACGLALTGLTLLGHSGELLVLPSLIALYDVAARRDRRTTLLAAFLASVWMGLLGWFGTPLGAPGGVPMAELLLPLLPLALGDAARSRWDLLAANDAALEAQLAGRIADERTAMARDVHDVVGHTLAGVTIQLAAAEAAYDVDRTLARDALGQARVSATQAMAELRSTVALLRQAPDTTAPPGRGGLSGLLAPLRRAGIGVTVTDSVPLGVELPAPVSLVAYRLIQEAVTNVLRHSGARQVWVELTLADDALTVQIADDGSGPPDPTRAASRGVGLVGMAERVHLAGGELVTEARDGGGFVVRTSLPLAGRTHAAAGS